MRKGGGGRVTVLTPHVTAWESKGNTMDMGRRSYGRERRGRAKDIYNRVPQGGTKECPVEGCPGRAGTRTVMRVHFCRRHVRDVVIILERGNLPHPRCQRCNMLVPWRSLNGRHKSTAMCRSGAEKKRRRLAEAEVRYSAEMAFEVYREQLQLVPSLKYLERILTEGGDDWPAVVGNLGKARKS